VLVREAGLAQRVEQHMVLLDHAVAIAVPGLEERPYPGLEQHRPAVERLHQQRAAGERYAVQLVRRRPAGPHRPRGVAEHRPAVELLGVAFDRPELHSSATTSAEPTGLRGSVPPSSASSPRSQATVCMLPQVWLEVRPWARRMS